ncbi:uncharacterized protein PG998_002326 [Apiospora kogelbergensis]|uniref:Uncharacterized protein n=1 Tax=Apiospora kogelbergensis TaxID=1337665 RepID=A0AAW0QG59_9PEZI
MSAEASAAAATPTPAATTSPTHVPIDHTNHFNTSGKAVIEWEAPGVGSQCLVHPDPRNRHLTFEVCLEKDGPQCFSFFRLRVPVTHMHLHAIVLYIHIPPSHISSIEWTFDDDTVNSDVQSKLGNNLTRLRFHLKKPAQVIVPDQVPLTPKKPATGAIFKALESLATALSMTVYLEHTTLSKARLASISEVIQSGLCRSVSRYGDLHRLYQGMGGSILPLVANLNNPDSEVHVSAQAESPPSYYEIGPGPPMPPVALGPGKETDSEKRPCKRRRQCSGSSTQSDDASSSTHMPVALPNKAKGEAMASMGALDDDGFLPPWAHSVFAELAELRGVVTMQEKVIQGLQQKVMTLESQAKAQDDEHAVLQGRMDQTDVAIVELDATSTQQGESLAELEDGLASLQEDWDSLSGRRVPEMDQMREELRVEIMGRLKNAMEEP